MAAVVSWFYQTTRNGPSLEHPRTEYMNWIELEHPNQGSFWRFGKETVKEHQEARGSEYTEMQYRSSEF